VTRGGSFCSEPTRGAANRPTVAQADWHFIEHIVDVPGAGICPVPGLLTEAHGTLHDDERGNVDCSAQCNSDENCAMVPGANGYGTGCNAGYADNANWCVCVLRVLRALRAPRRAG
jgi:hypothetical protein